MFERILLTTDFSPHSLALLELTLELARIHGSRIFLLHVDEEEQLFSLRGSDSLIRFVNEIQSRRETAMEALADRIRASGIPVERLRARGIASEQILELAQLHRVELLAISTVGVESAKRALIGSTAKKVLRHTPCSVLLTNPYCRPAGAELWGSPGGDAAEEADHPDAAPAAPEAEPVPDGEWEAAAEAAVPEQLPEEPAPEEPAPSRPSAWPPIRRILAPLSLEEQSRGVIEFAAAVAQQSRATLELLHVLKVPTLFPWLPGEPPLTLPPEFLGSFRGAASSQLSELATAIGQGSVEWTVTLAADEAEEIAAHAQRSHADLIILPRRTGTALGGFLFGRVSSAVAKVATVPTLLYVPPGEGR